MEKIFLIFLFFLFATENFVLAKENLAEPPRPPDARETTPIVFHHGKNSMEIERTIIRGESACYTFFAHKGQRLDTFLDDGPDKNVYLSVFEPGYRPKKDDLIGIYFMSGKSLPSLGNDTDKKEAHTILKKTGKYVMCLSLGRGGGGNFKNIIEIK